MILKLQAIDLACEETAMPVQKHERGFLLDLNSRNGGKVSWSDYFNGLYLWKYETWKVRLNVYSPCPLFHAIYVLMIWQCGAYPETDVILAVYNFQINHFSKSYFNLWICHQT